MNLRLDFDVAGGVTGFLLFAQQSRRIKPPSAPDGDENRNQGHQHNAPGRGQQADRIGRRDAVEGGGEYPLSEPAAARAEDRE